MLLARREVGQGPLGHDVRRSATLVDHGQLGSTAILRHRSKDRRFILSDDREWSVDPAGKNKPQSGESDLDRDRARKKNHGPRVASRLRWWPSSSRFDNSAMDAFGQDSSRSASRSSIEGSVICLSPILNAISRTSLPDNKFRSLVVAISTISNPVSSLFSILTMQVRATT